MTGDVVPFLEPFLELIQRLGAKVGLVVNDVKIADGQIKTSLNPIKAGFDRMIKSVIIAIDTFRTKIQQGID